MLHIVLGALVDFGRAHAAGSVQVPAPLISATATPVSTVIAQSQDCPAMPKLFQPSPLPRAQLAEDIDLIDSLFLNQGVQLAAAACCRKLAKLAEVAALRSEISRVIDFALNGATDLSAEFVIAALGSREAQLDDAIEDAREDRAEHDAAHKARLDRLRPLLAAVGELSARCATERDSLLRYIDGCWRAGTGDSRRDANANRYATLVAGGLTNEQIVKLGVSPVEEPVVKAAGYQARLAEVNAVLAQCNAFGACPLKDPGHLTGLGLDAVVANVFPDYVAAETEVA